VVSSTLRTTFGKLDNAFTNHTYHYLLHTVFPDLFPRQMVSKDGEHIPVRSYDDFLQYLLDKDSGLQIATLPFDGKNKVIYKVVI